MKIMKWPLIKIVALLLIGFTFETKAQEQQQGVDEISRNFETLMRSLRDYSYEGADGLDPFQEWEAEQKDEEPKVLTEEEAEKRNLAPLERWSLDELTLLGVVWGVDNPKAMIQDPSGKVHIVKKNAKIGLNGGYIAVVREGEIVIVESFETDTEVKYETRVKKIKR